MQIQNNLIFYNKLAKLPLAWNPRNENSGLLKNKFSGLSFSGTQAIDKFDTSPLNFIEDMEDIQTLNKLAETVKQSENVKDKHNLLNFEEKILWQEAENPERYINRALMTSAMKPVLENKGECIAKLRECSLYGLFSHYIMLKTIKISIGDLSSHFPLIEKIIKRTPDNYPFANKIKLNSIYVLNSIYDNLDTNSKEKTQKLLFDILKEKYSDDCKKSALDLLIKIIPKDDPAFQEVQKNIKDTNSKTDKRTALISLGKIRDLQLQTTVPEILKDEKAEHSLKIAAVWCAGRVKTEENYKLLSGIIKSPSNTDKDLELKEMALHSFTLYLRKHPNEIKTTLKKISKSDSPLNDAAYILLQKAQGNFNQEDRFLNEKILDESERKNYKKLRAQYINGLEDLNPKQKNRIDEALIPYHGALKEMTAMSAKFFITNDIITGIKKYLTGKRTGNGRFWESVRGSCGNNSSVINKTILKRSDNAVAHEFEHGIHDNILDKKDCARLEELYNKAKKENKCLDSYAALNGHEYFAQGYEAYISIYKPHVNLIDSDNYESPEANTRSVLKRKDPELYDFIKDCTKKYGQLETLPN